MTASRTCPARRALLGLDHDGVFAWVALIFDEPFEMNERVGQLRLQPAPRRQAIDQHAQYPAVRRILDAHDNLRTGSLAFDPKIETTAQRVCADERKYVAVDEAIDFEQFFFVTGYRRADGYLAAEPEWA